MKKLLCLLFFVIINAYCFAVKYVSDDYTINDYYHFALRDEQSDLFSLLTKEADSFRPDFFDDATDEKIKLIVEKLYENPSKGSWVLSSIEKQNPFTLMVIEKKYFNINFIYEDGKTLLRQELMTLYAYDRPDTIYIYLLENGADPNIKDDNGERVLELLVKGVGINWERVENVLKYVDDMKDYKTDILYRSFEKGNNIWKECVEKNIDINTPDSKGKSPLYLASEWGNLEAVKLLVEHGANVDAVNKEQKTPLMVACEKNRAEIVSYLISKKANLNKYDDHGWTPLFYSMGKTDIMKMLLDAGANPNAKNKENYKTPVAVKCIDYLNADCLDSLQLLGQYKTNFKAVNGRKENALSVLGRSFWKYDNEEILDIVDFLVSKGCNINSRDYLGRSLMNYCEDPDLAEELIKRGAKEEKVIFSSEEEYFGDGFYGW